MPSFLSSLQGKAQAALDKSGLGVKLPMSHTAQAQQPLDTHGNPVQGGGAAAAADSPDGKASRPFMVESLTHHLKALHNQYAPQGPPEVRHLQVLITNAKGVALDWESVGRDLKSLSKDFYLWGQDQEEDIKDVTDRLAFLNFVQGSLASGLSDKLDAARDPLKKLRESQAALAPRQGQRTSLEAQLKRLQGEGGKNPATEARIRELQETLRKNVADDGPMEREVADLRRKAVVESEQVKWDALKEFAEKLLMVCQASSLLLSQLPATAPTSTNPYSGYTATASIRSSLQDALNNYIPGQTTLPPVPHPEPGVGINVDTRSFGESHASELSRVPSFSDTVKTGARDPSPLRGPAPAGGVGGFIGGPSGSYADPKPLPQGAAQPYTAQQPALNAAPSHPAPVIDPASLNQSPAPIPGHATYESSASGIGSGEGSIVPAPTIAEAGIPLTAGPEGPGPARGRLSQDTDVPSYSAGGASGVGGFRAELPDAEDEKRRLEREERERVLALGASMSPGSVHESAEDEKRRLEREERERVLRGEGGSKDSKDGGPPPYS